MKEAIRFARGEPVGRITRYHIQRKGDRVIIRVAGEPPRIYRLETIPPSHEQVNHE